MFGIGGAGGKGIIPAYAGNTAKKLFPNFIPRDHPRVCGEHPSSELITIMSIGSSPRMRGTLAAERAVKRRYGIIPAYAGNTGLGLERLDSDRDHPRVCGEHVPGVWTCRGYWGSSPRMRGTPPLMRPARIPRGIIPAYAGNTGEWTQQAYVVGDHPRVCGEHQCKKTERHLAWGSSPRMRGTPKSKTDNAKKNGIIPAYAGNTIRCS